MLASLSTELQRILTDLDYKYSFIKLQYTNSDHATYIAMANVFINYVKDDVMPNIKLLLDKSLVGYNEDIVQVTHKYDE
jgi:hypothetical protein